MVPLLCLRLYIICFLSLQVSWSTVSWDLFLIRISFYPLTYALPLGARYIFLQPAWPSSTFWVTPRCYVWSYIFFHPRVNLNFPPRSDICTLGPFCWLRQDQSDCRISSHHTCERNLSTSNGFLCAPHLARCLNDAVIDGHNWRSRAEAAADQSAHSVPKATVLF